MTSFHHNDSIIITEENDHFGLLPQVETIEKIIVADQFLKSGIKTVALYGGWGTGKSSVMETVGTRLNKKDLVWDFFPAWKFEKDDNLALSLLHFLARDCDPLLFDELSRVGGAFLMGLAKGVTIKLGPVKLGFKDAITDTQKKAKEIESEKPSSIFALSEKFEAEFEKLITSRVGKKKKLIIFIDDLDRCDPEGVLNLLSAIKNFFTFDRVQKRVLFIVGIDKIAVEQAIKTKYSEVIRSDEYLEKIFDFSFELRKPTTIEKLVALTYSDSEQEYQKRLADYFTNIDFTVPRRVKKVLNNVNRLMFLKSIGHEDDGLFSISFNINNVGYFFENIFLLNLIILKEFYPEKYKKIRNFNDRINSLLENYDPVAIQGGRAAHIAGTQQIFNEAILNMSFHRFVLQREAFPANRTPAFDIITEKEFQSLLTLFLPDKAHHFNSSAQFPKFFDYFKTEGNEVQINMAKYLYVYRMQICSGIYPSTYYIHNYFELIDKYT